MTMPRRLSGRVPGAAPIDSRSPEGGRPVQQTIQRVDATGAIDPAIPREFVIVRAADGVETWGILYTPAQGRARTAVHIMHQRGDMSRHYIVPGLVGAGYAVYASNSRYLNNDRRSEEHTSELQSRF